MKAWYCRNRDYETDYATIVFAETRGKAKTIAQNTDACEDTPFLEIECTRAKAMDKHYRGLPELDWYNRKDRIALVKDGGFRCSYEISKTELECVDGGYCPAMEWCERCEHPEEKV